MSDKEAVVLDERPIFEVVSQHFASGLKTYEKGEQIVWAVPEGWDEKKYGKHFSVYGPSITFRPVNPPAEKLLKEHRKVIEDRNRPRPTVAEEMLAETRKSNDNAAKLIAQNQKMLEMLIELVKSKK